MNDPLLLAAGGALLALLALLLARALRAPRREGAVDAVYRGRAIMSDNELEFFGRLVVALPEHYIFPQVGMPALLVAANADRRRAHGARLRIAQQRIDYVVCNRRCEVVAVVELDDRTHVDARDRLRDARLAQGGYRTVRFESRRKPAAAAIRAAILPPAPGAEAAPLETPTAPRAAPAA